MSDWKRTTTKQCEYCGDQFEAVDIRTERLCPTDMMQKEAIDTVRGGTQYTQMSPEQKVAVGDYIDAHGLTLRRGMDNRGSTYGR